MVGSRPIREKSIGSQRQDQFLNLEWRRDCEVSVHTTYTSRSHSRSGSHVSHGENTRNMQLEIDHLWRKLCRKQRRGTPSSSEFYFDDDDGSYRPRVRTPPNESFSCDEDHHHRRRSRSLSRRGLGNDAMGRALRQISKSLFTWRIEGGKLSWRFTQPTFTRVRTPPNESFFCESFSCDEDRHHRRRSRSPSHRGLGNDAMGRALRQISKSLFTRRIEGGKLSRRFTQPTFTMYNGRMDLVEHVSYFNQRMAVHSRNEALMCKVFPPSLGLMAMRWFDWLE